MTAMSSTPDPYLRWLSCTAVATLLVFLAPAVEAFEWQIVVVDSAGDVGRDTDLSLDESGQPHISYYDKTNGDLKYAYLNSSGWHLETVDSEGIVGSYTSLALDGDGYPHISYHGGDGLRRAYKDVSGWHTEVVAAGGEHTSLALSEEGYAYISYCADSSLYCAYEDVAGWSTDTVDVASAYTYGSSLTLDVGGNPHIGYEAGLPDYIGWGCAKYAYKDASGWHIEMVDSVGGVHSGAGAATSLALDAAGRPHISGEAGLGALRYAYKQGSSWQIVYPGYGNMSVGSYSSLALDGNGYPCILWHRHGGHCYIWQDGAGWHLEDLEPQSGCPYDGGYPSLALDGAGYPHVSYYDAIGGDLKYAYVESVTSSEEAQGSSLPGTVRLLSVCPNPATTRTSILYSLDSGSSISRHVSLQVYDALGQHVVTPFEDVSSGGTYSTQLNLRSDEGRLLPSGVYYLRMQADNPEAGDVRRLVVVK
jgi:hypothetical protein